LTGGAVAARVHLVEPRLVAFLGIAALVIATPGPDTALTIRNTLRGGRPGGLGTALGVATGQAVWTIAASAGVAAVLVASAPVFGALRLAGAAYLVWLGIQAMRAALRSRQPAARGRDVDAAERLAPTEAFRQGIVSNLGNPKMAVFFTSLLPQFAPAGPPSFAALLALGLLFCAMTLTWLAGYAMAIAKAGQVLARPRIRRALEGLMGAALVALGIRLALGSR
jgi:threonine/homoserine/homoserine lactone efflux protein